jgi:uncharacterized protein
MIIGRQEEIAEMESTLKDKKSYLVMLTGRRRVGKTYLINQVYKDNIVFRFIGTRGGDMANQLKKFKIKLKEFDKKNTKFNTQENWTDAFENLILLIKNIRKSSKKMVLVFDEFPWMESENSDFLNEFSYWWNDWGVEQNIVVAISGSATTWMIDKIISDRGGLHNRVTKKIHLEPFTLAETKQMVHTINNRLSDYDILQLYMCMGGIPLYLEQIKKGESTAQSIHRICFSKSGLLSKEFDELYAALFTNYDSHIAVIKALCTKWIGLTRTEIQKVSKIKDGGGLTKILKELESCNFIMQIEPLINKKKGMIYRLADEYSRFYLTFIEGGKYTANKNWMTFQNTSKTYTAWQGYAFENICIKHADAIKKELGISGILTSVNSYYKAGTSTKKGLQVDMIIDRADNAVNLCEIKFYNKPIVVDAKFTDVLRIKRASLIEQTQIKKAVFNTVISTFGLEYSEHISSEIDNEVQMLSLFALGRF